jgi:hypoxanthine phosphoribosyltransferase
MNSLEVMEIVIHKKDIKREVKKMAKRICKEHKASGNNLPPVMLCVLNGAFMFFTDLVKNMDIDVQIDFIRAKSYDGQDNSGGVKILKDIELDLKGKMVYIIEDIIDTGATMLEILQSVNDKMPQEVTIVTLVQRKKCFMSIDHYCFEIGDEWIVGYGLDDYSLKRNYRNVYKINE